MCYIFKSLSSQFLAWNKIFRIIKVFTKRKKIYKQLIDFIKNKISLTHSLYIQFLNILNNVYFFPI